MQRPIATALIVLLTVLMPSGVFAQQRRSAEPTGPAASAEKSEIRLDETTTLKAAALEARMAALVANFALLQRHAQDIQQEMKTLLEERKQLIEAAGKKANVEVKDTNEWAFDNKGQRYMHIRRGTQPTR